MAQAITFARTVEFSPFDVLRTVIVSGCAFALILAGQALPAISL